MGIPTAGNFPQWGFLHFIDIFNKKCEFYMGIPTAGSFGFQYYLQFIDIIASKC